MSAAGEEFLAWLTDAITTREQQARAALAFGDGFVGEADCVYGTGFGGPYLRVVVPGFEGQTEAAAKHFALHAPEAILRRCVADQRLLRLHVGKMHSCPAVDETGYLDEWTHFGHGDLCPVVHALAEGYGWAGETSAPVPAQALPTDGDQVT